MQRFNATERAVQQQRHPVKPIHMWIAYIGSLRVDDDTNIAFLKSRHRGNRAVTFKPVSK